MSIPAILGPAAIECIDVIKMEGIRSRTSSIDSWNAGSWYIWLFGN